MDLLALAVPFFLLAMLLELIVDRVRGTGYYRTNDAINSLSAVIFLMPFCAFAPCVIGYLVIIPHRDQWQARQHCL